MSWGAVAIAGASIVGGVMQKNSADDATEASREASAEQLAFEKERYQDWQDVYGPLQENLSDYYTDLTPEFYEAVGLQNYQQELQSSLQAIETNLAQAGLTNRSGIEQSLKSQAELAGAEERAQIRSNAERQVQEDRTRFLQIGLGQNPASSVSNVLAQQSSNLSNIAQQQQIAAGQAMGNAVSTTGTALSNYFNNTNNAGSTNVTGGAMGGGVG